MGRNLHHRSTDSMSLPTRKSTAFLTRGERPETSASGRELRDTARRSHRLSREAACGPGSTRKNSSASQAMPQSSWEQKWSLTPKLPADTKPPRKAGKKVGLTDVDDVGSNSRAKRATNGQLNHLLSRRFLAGRARFASEEPKFMKIRPKKRRPGCPPQHRSFR